MQTGAALLLLLLVLAACDGDLPTAPLRASISTAGEPAVSRRRPVTPGIREVPAPCAAPAPFLRKANPAPGFIVVYRNGVDAETTTRRLAEKYGFEATHVWNSLSAFYTLTSIQTVAALRCEPEVRQVEENGYAMVGSAKQTEHR